MAERHHWQAIWAVRDQVTCLIRRACRRKTLQDFEPRTYGDGGPGKPGSRDMAPIRVHYGYERYNTE